MKKFLLYIKSHLQAIRIIGKRIYNNIFLGQKLSYKATRLRDYVYKVAMEDYQPVSLADLEDEEWFNPNKRTGDARRILAKAWFLKLAEY